MIFVSGVDFDFQIRFDLSSILKRDFVVGVVTAREVRVDTRVRWTLSETENTISEIHFFRLPFLPRRLFLPSHFLTSYST